MKEKHCIQYQPTSTYGNVGDMSVDGVLNYNTAFAVYAPEIYNDNKTIEKLKSDFNGFIKHKNNGLWSGIQIYYFVIKRERAGITSTIINLIYEFIATKTFHSVPCFGRTPERTSSEAGPY